MRRCFSTFGMNGKSKKVSKLFKDEKLSLLEKENVWIRSDNAIVCWDSSG
jgi:tRNA(Ile)-lysidine synthase